MFSFHWMIITLILTYAVIFVNGWTDAPNAIATAVATGALSMRRAAAMAAACNCLGVAVMCRVSPAVAYSVNGMVNLSAVEPSPRTMYILLCATLSAIVFWSVGAWVFGLPTSESHSLIAALTGAALGLGGGSEAIRWTVWRGVMAGLLVSMAVGFAGAYLACFGLEQLRRRRFYGGRRRRTGGRRNGGRGRAFQRGQIAAAMAMAFMHGAQDGQKLLALLLLSLRLGQAGGGEAEGAGGIPLWLSVSCALVMGLGTATGGGRIVEKMGRELVLLKPHQGCAADSASALCLLGASLLGFPVSTTHVKTAAILGAGLCGGSAGRMGGNSVDAGKSLTGRNAGRSSAGCVNGSVVRELMITWLTTFPGCMLLGFALAKGLAG